MVVVFADMRGQNSKRSSTVRLVSKTVMSPTGYGQNGFNPGIKASCPGSPEILPKMERTPLIPSCTV